MIDNQTGGSMLEAWRVSNGHYKSWLAAKVGVNQATLYRWVNGSANPRQTARIAIEHITGGAVPASAWDCEQ